MATSSTALPHALTSIDLRPPVPRTGDSPPEVEFVSDFFSASVSIFFVGDSACCIDFLSLFISFQMGDPGRHVARWDFSRF
mmetsp:Transcript_14449/g.37488  ORF Transcript_14449/g.37488 Transcript_14449/m.37488 type:complete len:81 (-) Transcript_14449:1101-1343(-)